MARTLRDGCDRQGTVRRRVGTKTQDPSRQMMVRREDRIRLLKMKAEPRQEGSP